MRMPHFWKRAGAASAPSSIVVFDCETWHGDRAKVEGGEYHTLRLGVAYAYRLERGKRTREKWLTFKHSSELWEFVKSRLDKRRPLWVFAHNTPYDMGAADGWRWIFDQELEVSKAIVNGGLFWLKGAIDGATISISDTTNYHKVPLAKLGKDMGLPKMEMPSQDQDDSAWECYCKNDVLITAKAIDSLIEFIRTNELGPWQASIAGLAFSAYRHRFMGHKVLVHVCRPALELERAAYYGGLVDTPFIGRIPSDCVYELDVCSMYPAACLEPLPYHLVGTVSRPSESTVRDLMKQYQVIAEVELCTSDWRYPVRVEQSVYHPLGHYTTALPDPELRVALARGHVRSFKRIAYYKAAPIFKTFMNHFMALKCSDRARTDATFRTLCKYYGNSLYGKTGQESPKWREWDQESLEEIERQRKLKPGSLRPFYGWQPAMTELEEEFTFTDFGFSVKVRCYYGPVEVRVGETESRDSCPAIAATVTSYGRVKLRTYQEIAGERQWFYSDTDSIWVTRLGLERLTAAGCIGDEELGKLKVERSYRRLIVYGPKDYRADGKRRCKGVRARARKVGSATFEQLQFPSALAQMKRGEFGGVFVRQSLKRLRRVLTKCLPCPGGWTRPLIFPENRPTGVDRAATPD